MQKSSRTGTKVLSVRRPTLEGETRSGAGREVEGIDCETLLFILELEAENKRLKQLARDQRTSAIDWCSVAKKYQQDRNFMVLRLADLEHRITKKAQRNSDPHKDTAVQVKQEPDVDTDHKDNSAWMNVVNQTLAEILDHMYVKHL